MITPFFCVASFAYLCGETILGGKVPQQTQDVEEIQRSISQPKDHVLANEFDVPGSKSSDLSDTASSLLEKDSDVSLDESLDDVKRKLFMAGTPTQDARQGSQDSDIFAPRTRQGQKRTSFRVQTYYPFRYNSSLARSNVRKANNALVLYQPLYKVSPSDCKSKDHDVRDRALVLYQPLLRVSPLDYEPKEHPVEIKCLRILSGVSINTPNYCGDLVFMLANKLPSEGTIHRVASNPDYNLNLDFMLAEKVIGQKQLSRISTAPEYNLDLILMLVNKFMMQKKARPRRTINPAFMKSFLQNIVVQQEKCNAKIAAQVSPVATAMKLLSCPKTHLRPSPATHTSSRRPRKAKGLSGGVRLSIVVKDEGVTKGKENKVGEENKESKEGQESKEDVPAGTRVRLGHRPTRRGKRKSKKVKEAAAAAAAALEETTSSLL